MRKHITPVEFSKMLAATGAQRHEERDRAMLLVMYRHGLRVSELVAIQLSDIDLDGRSIYCRRIRRGLSTAHPLSDDELHAVKQYLSVRGDDSGSQTLFISERGAPLSRQQVHYLVSRYAQLVKLEQPVHPDMLRYGCGFALSDRGADARLVQDYLGYRSIQGTVTYAAANLQCFEGLWK